MNICPFRDKDYGFLDLKALALAISMSKAAEEKLDHIITSLRNPSGGVLFINGDFKRRKCQGLESQFCGSIDPPFDIPARHKLRYKSTRELLPALSEIFKEYDQFVNVKTTSTKPPHPDLSSFIRKCRPVNHCLHRHCGGSVEKFVRRWGESVYYTSFSRDCCPGTGRMESDICQQDDVPRLNKVDSPMTQQIR
uniref:Uncharacterized protein n=1 Tax=Spongospora subterranea TaxID=70186 RepID=A0A0H5QWZ3_9EUKA|eukprot:CRZ06498.1 hypothetical protein [Spongospora subterranea]